MASLPPLRAPRRLWRRGGTAETGADRSARVYLTLGIVVISLLSLAAVPMLLYEKSSCPVSEVAEPVQGVIIDIGTLVALESDATSSLLLTGNAEHTATFRWVRERRRLAVRELLDISVLGPGFKAEARRLAEYLAAVDKRLDALHGGRLTPAEYVQQLKVEGSPSAAVADSSQALRDIIAGRVARHRQTTHTAEKRASVLSVLSTVLAIIAVIAVARLGGRYRLAADREHAARARSEEACAEAERRRREVERVSASRDVLVRGFSHDLGNPLVAADWHLRLLQAAGANRLTAAQAGAVSSAHQSIKTAVKMVADLLALARAEAGQIRVRRAPMDIGALASAIVQDFEAAAEGKGLPLKTDIPDDLPLIESDSEYVRQILSNLLANAIKYTPAGEIRVRVNAVGGNGSGAGAAERVTVEVSDTGPGLDEEQQKNVFKEFYRVDIPGTVDGAGIGLAISNRLALALGGNLGVKSEPGRGSTFILELPLEREAQAA